MITQEDVNAAVGKITAAGVKPTARAVREALGEGSMATVLKYLQVWQAGQAKPVKAPQALSPAVQKAITDFVGNEVSAAIAALEGELATVRQENADLIAESERLASVMASQSAGIDDLRTEKAEISGRLQEIERELIQSQGNVEMLRQEVSDLRTEEARLQQRLEQLPTLAAENAALRAALESERNARVAAEVAAAELRGQLTAAGKGHGK